MATCQNIFLLLSLAVLIPTLNANILESEEYWRDHATEFDSYWKERAAAAAEKNEAAYFADPYSVSGNFTSSVSE